MPELPTPSTLIGRALKIISHCKLEMFLFTWEALFVTNDTHVFAVKILPGIETKERKPKGRDFPQQQERLFLGLVDACLLMTRQVRTAQPYRW